MFVDRDAGGKVVSKVLNRGVRVYFVKKVGKGVDCFG